MCHTLIVLRIPNSCQTKIANFENTITVDKKIARLDISVQNRCAMQIFESAENLIDKDFDVVASQLLRGDDDLVQVGLHQFGEDVAENWYFRGA